MFGNFPGYQISELLYESSTTLVYRGLRICDSRAVILKTLKTNYPTASAIAKFKHEYEIAKPLNISGLVKIYTLETHKNRPTLVLEDFNGQDLGSLLITQTLDLKQFFKIALQLAQTLEELHAEQVIHKDIKPQNIIVNLETEQFKLSDFSLSSQLQRESQTISNPNLIAGTLAYMSPEQTGRMNRTVDNRTDFYSLGITFYEILTGQLPFQSTDPLELVHAHIAKQPVPPDRLNPKIPRSLSNLVMKLLAKTAEERYQSAFGIKADLEACLQHYLQEDSAIITLGRQDFSGKFEIPQKLYGREREVETLLAAFERVAGDNSQIELMLVSGYSGIGKSSLVNEVHKPIVRQRGFFISGKFDQFQRNIPYASLIQAVRELVQQILTESEEKFTAWQAKILAALGANGQVIIDVIPEVESIIGEQPQIPQLGPTESQNRFNFVFQEFLGVFAKREHPLVLFLDDLQWADSASLNFIKTLMTAPESQYLLLIGAYRDNEVSPSHPLMLILHEIENTGAKIENIVVEALQLDCVTQLITETLNCDREKATSLAELCIHKTQGNPFFLNQLLSSLYAERAFEFDFKAGTWRWDWEQIQKIGITDNVVELMIQRIKKLEPQTQDILKLAACIGNKFNLDTLAVVSEQSRSQAVTQLWEALQKGLILPLSDTYKIPLAFARAGENWTEDLQSNYKFLHDRVQQAAYSIIPEEKCKEMHLKIGQLLYQNSNEQEREEQLFDIVNHFNLATELIVARAERDRLARLNQKAGNKAKESTAYEPAAQYFQTAIELLSSNAWQENYELAFALHRELSECEYLCSYFEKAEELFDRTLQNARSELDKAEIQNIRLALYDTAGKYLENATLGSEALANFGIAIPTQEKAEILSAFERELQIYRTNSKKCKISELVDAPKMVDPQLNACMKLLMNITGPAYFTDHDLLALTCLKMANLSMEHGNSEVSAHGYAFWGIILGSRLGEYKTGYEFGQLALKLSEQYNNLTSKVFNLFGGLISPWRSHLQTGIPIVRASYQAAVATGDAYSSYSSYNLIMQRIIANDPFNSILEESDKLIDFLTRMRNYVFVSVQEMDKSFIFNFQGLTKDKLSLSNDSFDEVECVKRWQDNLFLPGVATYNIFKSQIFYFYGQEKEALQFSQKSEETVVFVSGIPNYFEHYYYYSLILTALYPEASEEEQRSYWEILERNRALIENWANNCPANFLNKHLLVEAEIARITGQGEAAMNLYDRAIASAREHGFIQNEALGNELAAKFWLEKGKDDFAELYFKKARYAYQQWGATRKVEDLEEKYPQFLATSLKSNFQKLSESSSFTLSTSEGDSSTLDLITVTKASRTISGEIVLDKLLARLMQLAVENAGAQRGLLILADSDRFTIEAAKESDRAKIEVLQSLDVNSSKLLPLSLIQYLQRTLKDVVIGNATQEKRYRNDPYIARTQPKSILAAPILNQGKLIGIVYLENNLTPGVFTRDRVELVKILAAQAAIAIENARLYRTLEERVKERTAQLAEANAEISTLNERLKKENLRMSAELEIAKQLQQMVLPNAEELEAIEGLEIAGFMEPAEEVGGDYYDVLKQENGAKITIGDVTGHGIESGVLTIMAQTAVRMLKKSGETDPVRFFDLLNQTLYDNLQRMRSDKNMTLATIDYQAGKLYLSGQHEELIIVRVEGTIERIDTIDLGFPLGLDTEIADFFAREEVELATGDVAVLYTDGITEAENCDRAQYGLERLCELIQTHRHQSAREICQNIVDAVHQHIGEQKVFDDITLLVMKQQ